MRKSILVLSFLSFAIVKSYSQEVKQTISSSEWKYDSLGNHRAVIDVPKAGEVAKVVLKWRRRDFQPEKKEIIVIDGKTKKRILNVKTEDINRVQGTIYFQPISGAGRYYIYYLSYTQKGSPYYPTAVYTKDSLTASDDWLDNVKSNKYIVANAAALESVNVFNSFDPMELIATPEETNKLISKYTSEDYIAILEDRLHSIKMTKDLPYRWIQNPIKKNFIGAADKGENFAFQIGLFAHKQNLKNVIVELTDLKSGSIIISNKNFDVLNNEGVNWIGKPIHFQVVVDKGKVQPIWCLLDIPEDATPGIYMGTATIKVDGLKNKVIPIQITITNKTAINHGTNEPWKQTRLTWLNSKLAEKNALMSPYTALQLNGNTIGLLGRNVEIDKSGFPKQIQSFFSEEMTTIESTPKKLLTEAIHFHIKDEHKKDIVFSNSPIDYTEKSSSIVSWNVSNKSESLYMDVNGTVEFDGFVNYEVKLIAQKDISLKEITLHIPIEPSVAEYFMGLGEKGELRPEKFSWKWDVAKKNQDGAWIGTVNAGLQFGLRDENYSRPLNTNFYLKKPLILPSSWGNGDKGGVNIGVVGKSVLVDCYSGERTMKKGDTLYYNFRLLVTPFHTINTDFQWENRFVHKYLPVEEAKKDGASVINIHQGTPINPYINYPFVKTKEMKSYIDSAHRLGMKVKIYNTVRELSNRAYELPALFSLGNEIYSKGNGGGYSWLQEHLDSNYIAAWYTPEANDAAIINSGMSRWHNYYVEGMNWLTKNIGIDGIYLDDVAFDRDIMKRIKKVMTDGNHPGIIDLHSANQFNKSDGFINSANLYMELFPYLNRLWFGEYFDYENNSPDFFLTEVSGIPFGLMGEMLQNNGNPYRGLLYGMTNRLFWDGGVKTPADPTPIWKEWNRFGIEHSKMIGYWVKKNPVKTDNPKILATIYKKDKKVLVSIASWADGTTNFKLNIDWNSLDIDASKATIKAYEIKDFQPARAFSLDESIPVDNKKGWLLELSER